MPEPVVREVASPNDPMAVSRQFLRDAYTDADHLVLLVHHKGDFYSYDGTCWPELEDRTIRADLYRWLEPAMYWTVKGKDKAPELVPFEPNKYKVANVVEALQAIGHLSGGVETPTWLPPDLGPVPASEVVAMANGLLHVPSRNLLTHTPRYFTQHALPFAFDPAAPPPMRWLEFLAELWDGDTETISSLAEAMGYLIGGGTAQQKMFLLVGPRRSGKGTIGRVLTGILGPHNVAAPTLAGLVGNFGASPLIGKPLAIVSDARLGTRADSMVAVERLLSISGEDSITVDRKYRDPWTGRLPTRFLILTNELPRFTDTSGALASRFIVFVLTRSFLGREDPTLTETLLGEAAGILNWSLDGLDRLVARGYFVQPASSVEAARQLEDLASPVGAFVRDRCVRGADEMVAVEDLWKAWREWCESANQHPGTKAVFGRDLRATVPEIRSERPRVEDARVYVYAGVGLASEFNSAPAHGPPGPRAPDGPSGPGGPGSGQSLADVRDRILEERGLWASDQVVAARLAAFHHIPPPAGFATWTPSAVRRVMGEV